jgi:hypothetical protein
MHNNTAWLAVAQLTMTWFTMVSSFVLLHVEITRLFRRKHGHRPARVQ